MVAIQVQSHEQWLALRAECVVTASTVAALITEHPYETVYSCYCRATGNAPPVEQNEAMAAGTDAEFMMPARAARVRPGLRLVKNRSFYRHDRLRFGGTPDFWDQDGGCWQAKCVSPEVFEREWSGDEPPLYVMLQHQAEYLLSGARSGGILCLVRDRAFSTYLYDVPAHDGAMRSIEEAVEKFQRMVDDLDEPSPDFTRDSDLVIERFASAIAGSSVDLSTDNLLADLCARYLAASSAEKAAEADKKQLKAEILTKIGGAASVRCGAYSISAGMVAGAADKTITAEMVGSVIKGRSGYRGFKLLERNAA